MCTLPLKIQDQGGPSKKPPSSSVLFPPILSSRVMLPISSKSSKSSRPPSATSLDVVVVVVVVVVVGHMAICQLKAKSLRSSATCSSSFAFRIKIIVLEVCFKISSPQKSKPCLHCSPSSSGRHRSEWVDAWSDHSLHWSKEKKLDRCYSATWTACFSRLHVSLSCHGTLSGGFSSLATCEKEIGLMFVYEGRVQIGAQNLFCCSSYLLTIPPPYYELCCWQRIANAVPLFHCAVIRVQSDPFIAHYKSSIFLCTIQT